MGCFTCDLRPEKCDKAKFVPFNNLDFQMFSRKTRRPKVFVYQKFRRWSITTLSMHLSKKQADPTNAFVEKSVKVRKCSPQNGMSIIPG